MFTRRPALLIALTAGLLAGLIAFFSTSATAENLRAQDAPVRVATAVFAGGCFWCVEADFDKLDGVIDTVSGYTGGRTQRPTYQQVTRGGTGHYEAVKVTYDPARISYEQLARYFIRTIDPIDAGGQFCDRGESYRTAFFVASESERRAAEAVLAAAAAELRTELVTPVLAAAEFWPAEAYHQDYYLKNPIRYDFYRKSCGRDDRLRALWGNAQPGH
ncbi:peptide-methionine (S)-S-oxide reductase MsrA [Hyphomonas sp.]|uniref:peptide-methionine (S)-S-oxide reductase MsrA n=1 Tax=Hyphomonas sp. TaxID=87 RepID=UPI00391C620A